MTTTFRVTFSSGDLHIVTVSGEFTNPYTKETFNTKHGDDEYRVYAPNPLMAIEKAEKEAFNVKGDIIKVRVLKEKAFIASKKDLFQLGIDKYHICRG